MKIDFDGIQAFVMVAELGSFQKAADFLHLTQTALTRRIQKLESLLGVRLLDRTTRTVGLTVIGRGFLPQAQRLVAELTTGGCPKFCVNRPLLSTLLTDCFGRTAVVCHFP